MLANDRTHSENILMYWLMARSTPAAHPITKSTSRIIGRIAPLCIRHLASFCKHSVSCGIM